MDHHAPDFQNFVIHQLTIGQLEEFYNFYQAYLSGELPIKVIKHEPITEQEIKAFSDNVGAELKSRLQNR